MNRYVSTTSAPLWLLVLTGVLLIARIALVSFDSHQPKEAIRWHVVKIGAESRTWRRDHKPHLYLFTAAWWPACQTFEAGPLANPKVVNLISDKFVAIKVVDDRGPGSNPSRAVERLRKHFNVVVLPTIVVSDPDGRRVSDKDGEGTTLSVYNFLLDSLDRYSKHQYMDSYGKEDDGATVIAPVPAKDQSGKESSDVQRKDREKP